MKISFWQRILLGFGGGINAIKTDFFSFFRGFFYLTFLGLNPLLTGSAVLLALLFDAFSDPVIGTFSDRTKTNLGRRYPYMFLSLLPICICYVMLFIPDPSWSENQYFLFFWLLFFLILTRFFVSIFDVPHRALFSELGGNYVNNSRVMSMREGYQWIIGAGHSLVVYSFLGYFISDPYKWLYIGIFGSSFMLIFGVISLLGSKKVIPELYEWKPKQRKADFKILKKELSFVLKSKTLLLFIFGSLLIQGTWGLANSLSFLTYTKFWQFDPLDLRVLIYFYILAAIVSWVVTPIITRYLDKEKIVIASLIFLSLTHSLPFITHYLGLFDGMEQSKILNFMSVMILFSSIFSLISLMTRESMVPDIIDEIEFQSEKRQEGAVSSLTSFCSKCMSGLGQFISMFFLWIINYPPGGSEPSSEQLVSLFTLHGPVVSLLFLFPMLIFLNYKLSRKKHNKIKDNLELTNR